MKNSIVNWHGYENYNMNCSIEDLEKNFGFDIPSITKEIIKYLN